MGQLEDRGYQTLVGMRDATGAVGVVSAGDKWVLAAIAGVLVLGAAVSYRASRKPFPDAYDYNLVRSLRDKWKAEYGGVFPSHLEDEVTFLALHGVKPGSKDYLPKLVTYRDLLKGRSPDHPTAWMYTHGFPVEWGTYVYSNDQGNWTEKRLETFALLADSLSGTSVTPKALRQIGEMDDDQLESLLSAPKDVLLSGTYVKSGGRINIDLSRKLAEVASQLPPDLVKALRNGKRAEQWFSMRESDREKIVQNLSQMSQKITLDLPYYDIELSTLAKLKSVPKNLNSYDFLLLLTTNDPDLIDRAARELLPSQISEIMGDAGDPETLKARLQGILGFKALRETPGALPPSTFESVLNREFKDFMQLSSHPFTLQQLQELQASGISPREIVSTYQGLYKDDAPPGMNFQTLTVKAVTQEAESRARDKIARRDPKWAARQYPDEYRLGQKISDVAAYVVDEIVERSRRGEKVVIHGRDGELFYELAKRDPRAKMKNISYVVSPRTLTTKSSDKRSPVDAAMFEDYLKRVVPPNAWHYDTGYTGSIPKYIQKQVGIPVAGIRLVGSSMGDDNYREKQIPIPTRTNPVAVVEEFEGARHRLMPGPVHFTGLRYSPEAPGFWARLAGVMKGWVTAGRGQRVHDPVPPSVST